MADEVVKLIQDPIREISVIEQLNRDHEAINALVDPLRKTLSKLPFDQIPSKGFIQIPEEWVSYVGVVDEHIKGLQPNFEAINLVADPLRKTLSRLPFDQIPTRGFVDIPDHINISMGILKERTDAMQELLLPISHQLSDLQRSVENVWDRYDSVFATPVPMEIAEQEFTRFTGLLSLGSGMLMSETAEKELTNDMKLHYPDSVFVKMDEQQLGLQPSDGAKPIPLPEVREQLGMAHFLPTIGKSQLHNFKDHLKQFPMLALEDPAGTGRKILDAIRNMVPQAETHIQATLYRARKMKRLAGEKDLPLTEIPHRLLSLEEMYGPPTGISGQGRFNFTGQSVMYTCDNEDATLYEIRAGVDEFGTIYQFHIDHKFTMLDMTDDHPLFAHCMHKVENESSPHKVRREYFLPNFIAECCRFVGIDVIRYRSVQHENTINYVFFGFPDHYAKHTEAGRFMIDSSGAMFDWS